jgi:transposase
MILREVSMQIKLMSRDGRPKAAIARQFGVSRQTVYNHLKRSGPFPKARAPRRSKLERFKAYIRARLESFDLPATVLYRELRGQGYTGGLTILRAFVRPLKRELVRRVTERFETRPGRQAQIDWGECGTIEVEGERRKLYLFVLVLGYSRMMYARFTTSSKLPALLACLARAFAALGIPAEILVDNMKQAVDQHDAATGTVRWNKGFLDFAEHHGFLPAACPPYWPRVKGKVERGIGYVKRCFLEGRSFTDLDDLNRQLEVWLEAVANVRLHATTGERPGDRYARELPYLGDFARLPAYDTRTIEIRQVPPDCHISYGAVLYSVHPDAAGRSVTVRAEGESVGDPFTVYLGSEVVARHRRRPKGSPRVTLAEHAEAIRALTRGQAAAAYRRRGGRPHFLQLATPQEVQAVGAVERTPHAWPAVDVRSLSVYENLLHEDLLRTGAA